MFSFFSGLPVGSGEIETLRKKNELIFVTCAEIGRTFCHYRCETVFVSGIVAYSSSKWNIVFQHTGMSAVVGGIMFDDDDRWMPSTLHETPAANELFASANAFGNRNGLSNDMVGLFLMGVMAVSFKFV